MDPLCRQISLFRNKALHPVDPTAVEDQMKRRLLVMGVLTGTALICGLLVSWNFIRDYMIASYFANMPRPAQTVSSAEVKVKDWTPGITAIGTSRAVNGVDLAVQIGGRRRLQGLRGASAARHPHPLRPAADAA